MEKTEISTFVKSGRAAKGYTQQELADLVKVNLRSIQRIENGEVMPRAYTLKLLADALGFADKIASFSKNPTARLNKTRRIILSIGGAFILVTLTMAFISQSPRFPETTFEFFLLTAFVLIIYCWFLFWIWK